MAWPYVLAVITICIVYKWSNIDLNSIFRCGFTVAAIVTYSGISMLFSTISVKRGFPNVEYGSARGIFLPSKSAAVRLYFFTLLILKLIYIYIYYYVFIYYYYYHACGALNISFYSALYHRHFMLTIKFSHMSSIQNLINNLVCFLENNIISVYGRFAT